MNVFTDKAFGRDIKKVKDPELLDKVKSIIIDFENAENILEIRNIKKIEGKVNYYRLKIKNHRIGFKLIDNSIYLLRFLHRKDIYKFSP